MRIIDEFNEQRHIVVFLLTTKAPTLSPNNPSRALVVLFVVLRVLAD